jgi:hypothetical protein
MIHIFLVVVILILQVQGGIIEARQGQDFTWETLLAISWPYVMLSVVFAVEALSIESSKDIHPSLPQEWAEGYRAGSGGSLYKDNPYNRTGPTASQALWSHGFLAGREDKED